MLLTKANTKFFSELLQLVDALRNYDHVSGYQSVDYSQSLHFSGYISLVLLISELELAYALGEPKKGLVAVKSFAGGRYCQVICRICIYVEQDISKIVHYASLLEQAQHFENNHLDLFYLGYVRIVRVAVFESLEIDVHSFDGEFFHRTLVDIWPNRLDKEFEQSLEIWLVDMLVYVLSQTLVERRGKVLASLRVTC